MVTQTIKKTGNTTSSLFRHDPHNSLRNGTVLIEERQPEYLRKYAFSTETDYTNRMVHPYDREMGLKALYNKTKFDFRNYPQMPKQIQEEMLEIERAAQTGRE